MVLCAIQTSFESSEPFTGQIPRGNLCAECRRFSLDTLKNDITVLADHPRLLSSVSTDCFATVAFKIKCPYY